ncbi:MAG: TetR family transcriptional regulator [Desulfuromusa sp.]|jgi:TetR/AcrR family acrAB operon transcriptional repressor|nr:TetR family transcriptional regulator [Desulfuromusa sp.]
MARKTKEEAERTYHALLDAATKLFIRQGVAKTTLNQIASEAGMTRGAIYWHFNNKDAVIQALWERNDEKLRLPLSTMLSNLSQPYPAQDFCAAVKNLLHNIVLEPELGQTFRIILHSVEFTDEETEIQRFLNGKWLEFYSIIEDGFIALKQHKALRTDLAPDLLTHSLMSYIHGLIHSYLTPRNHKLDLQKEGDRLIDIFLNAVIIDQGPRIDSNRTKTKISKNYD